MVKAFGLSKPNLLHTQPHNNMKSKILLALSLLFMPLISSAQQAVDLGQVALSKWRIGTGNYSGITSLGSNRYAVVSDKEITDGFFTFLIDQNATTGAIESVYLESFKGNSSPKVSAATGISVRDCEGIAYFPPAGTVFIAGEGDQKILEYNMNGQPTGRELTVPKIFGLGNIVPNYGFESLAYCPTTHRFWTTTESTLLKDGNAAGPMHPGEQNLLRLQSFRDDLLPIAQYAYRMDRGKADDFGKIYVYGVSEIATLPDGRLLVMEREADISNGYLSSQCTCKIFMVNPQESWMIDSSTDLQKLDPNKFMTKRLIATFTTHMTPFKQNFANYEGMCLGRQLNDGRQTLLLISDSQGGYGKGPVHLKDYIRVLILPDF